MGSKRAKKQKDKKQKGQAGAIASPLLPSSYKTTLISLLIIAVVGFLSYSNTFNASFHFDDTSSITDNPSIKDLSNIKAIWQFTPTRFITYLSLAVNYHFGGLNLFGYHIVNLVIHILTAFLVFWFMRLILISVNPPTPPLSKGGIKEGFVTLPSGLWIVPLFASLLFVSHPIQTQAVTYIIQRTASLATFFYLLSMVLYIKTRCGLRVTSYGLNPQPATRNPQLKLLVLSLLSAVLAMFTKETAFTLPIAIVLIDFYFFSPSWSRMKGRITSLFPFLLTIFIIPFTMLITGKVEIGEIGRLASETQAITRWEYLLTQFNVVRTYVRLLFLPISQNLDYDYPISHTFFEGSTILSFLLLVLIVFIGIRLFKRNRIMSFGIFFFFLALSVESSIIPLREIIFEHRLYLPSVGFVVVVSMGLFWFLEYLGKYRSTTSIRHYPLYLHMGLIFFITTAAGIATYQRNKVWRDELSLWSDVVEKSPKKARGYHDFGLAYYRLDRYKEAIKEYQTALQLKPDYPKVYNDLGLASYGLRQYQKAIKEYKIALRLGPDFPKAHYNLGVVYYTLGRYQEAIKEYRMAIQIKPDYPEAHNNLGNVYNSVGRWQEAIQEYQITIRLKPDYPKAYNNLGNAYSRLGRWQEAIQEYQMALRLKSDYPEAHNNLGNIYARSGHWQEAIQEYQTA
ncbi:MAG: tetratricopeptide repeat protein, partial [Thermodesulfobacteriota bacterium]